jgi:peptide/nickel transport system ATP-binding protein
VALLDIFDLSIKLELDGRETRLLDGVSLQARRGEILGIVGESGSGKSMLALAVLRLLPRGIRVGGGSIRFDGLELTELSGPKLNALRGSRLSMIFQEPMTALNPAMRVGDQVREVIQAHIRCDTDEVRKRVETTLEEVGLAPAEQIAPLYPHELSGGMRQRVMIAVAIACAPDLIIADEPTTSLDVTLQLQILALLRSIVAHRGCALILITHDIGVISAMCDRVAVMYAGNLVETCAAATFVAGPQHPYSRLLLDTYVDVDMERVRPLPTITGSMPFAGQRLAGCRFHTRCPDALELCTRVKPQFVSIGSEHRAACHLCAARPSEMMNDGR